MVGELILLSFLFCYNPFQSRFSAPSTKFNTDIRPSLSDYYYLNPPHTPLLSACLFLSDQLTKSTLHEIKKIALSALPALRSSSDDSAHLPGLDPSDLADLDLPNPAATSFPHSSTKSTTKSKSDIPADINSTAGFCLWKAKRRVFADDSNGTGGEGEFLGYESLEGDDLEIGEEEANEEEKRERKAALSVKVRDLTNPAWGRWNEVYVR